MGNRLLRSVLKPKTRGPKRTLLCSHHGGCLQCGVRTHAHTHQVGLSPSAGEPTVTPRMFLQLCAHWHLARVGLMGLLGTHSGPSQVSTEEGICGHEACITILTCSSYENVPTHYYVCPELKLVSVFWGLAHSFHFPKLLPSPLRPDFLPGQAHVLAACCSSFSPRPSLPLPPYADALF